MWLPPPLCAIPTNHHHCVRCPALSAVCVCWWWDWAQRRTVVARTLVWRCAWRLATTPTSHAVHACRLSPLSCPQTHPHTHKWHCSLHTHMACFVCLVPSTHSHTGCLTAHTPSTHTGGCACAHPPALMRHHTHSAGTGVALAWLLWCCGHHHHAPCATHTHTGTGGGRHGGGWWWACGHCVAATPRHPLALPATTHATSTTTHTMACCLFGTPCHSHHHHSTPSHTPQQPLCHNGGCHWSPRRPHTPHTCHTRHTHTKGKHRRGCGFWCGTTTTLVLAIRCLLFFPSCPPTPFSLSLLHALTPLIPSSTTPPSHPSPVWCVLWEWTDGWTTLWLSTPHTALLMGVLIGDTIQPFHPPSPLSLCFCPPPTTTPSLFSAHHTHTHTEEKGRVGMDLLVLWVCDGWCGWHVWFVGGVVCWLCFAWLAHPITLSTPNHHHSPLFLSLHHPTLLCLCVWKRVDHKVDGVEWSVVCGMQHISHCAFIKPSPTPVCLWSFTIPFSLSNSFSSSLFVWFVWTERVKDKCGTHHVKHTVHHIQSTPHSFHPITPPFSMSTWLIGL